MGKAFGHIKLVFFRSSLVLALLSKVVAYVIGVFVVYEILIFGCTRRDDFFYCFAVIVIHLRSVYPV